MIDLPNIVFHDDKEPPKIQAPEGEIHLWRNTNPKYQHPMYMLKDRTWYPVVNYDGRNR